MVKHGVITFCLSNEEYINLPLGVQSTFYVR